MSRCTGHCCRCFTLPFSPEELKERAKTEDVEDAKQIAEMVIYRGFWNEKHNYTCKHLLPNGNCGNYESRPRMCSEYPYSGSCWYSECTWTERSVKLLEDLREVYPMLQNAPRIGDV